MTFGRAQHEDGNGVIHVSLASASDQAGIDKINATYWDELCGSQFARRIGVTDNSSASLK